jgi:hypothetical protein
MKVGEIRASLLQLDDDGKHTKHVAVTITNPALCAVIADAIGKSIDLEKAEDASHLEIKAKDEPKKPAA